MCTVVCVLFLCACVLCVCVYMCVLWCVCICVCCGVCVCVLCPATALVSLLGKLSFQECDRDPCVRMQFSPCDLQGPGPLGARATLLSFPGDGGLKAVYTSLFLLVLSMGWSLTGSLINGPTTTSNTLPYGRLCTYSPEEEVASVLRCGYPQVINGLQREHLSQACARPRVPGPGTNRPALTPSTLRVPIQMPHLFPRSWTP